MRSSASVRSNLRSEALYSDPLEALPVRRSLRLQLVAKFQKPVDNRLSLLPVSGQPHVLRLDLPEVKEKLVSVRVRDQQFVNATDVAVIFVLRLRKLRNANLCRGPTTRTQLRSK